MGIETGADTLALTGLAEEVVVPMMDQPIRVNHDSLILSYAGVYSSFLLHAKCAARKDLREHPDLPSPHEGTDPDQLQTQWRNIGG